MKKRISILLAALLVFSLAAPALAAHIDLDSLQDGNYDGYSVGHSNVEVSHKDNTLSGGDGSYSLNFTDPNASVELDGNVKTGYIGADGNLTINGPGSLDADGGINVNDTLTVGGGADVTGTSTGGGAGVYAGNIVVEDGSLTGKSEGSSTSQGIQVDSGGAVTIGDKVYTQTEFDALAKGDSIVSLTHTPQGNGTQNENSDDGTSPYTVNMYLIDVSEDDIGYWSSLPPSDRGYARNEIIAMVVEITVPANADPFAEGYTKLRIMGEDVTFDIVDNNITEAGASLKHTVSDNWNSVWTINDGRNQLTHGLLSSTEGGIPVANRTKTYKFLVFGKLTGDDPLITVSLEKRLGLNSISKSIFITDQANAAQTQEEQEETLYDLAIQLVDANEDGSLNVEFDPTRTKKG